MRHCEEKRSALHRCVLLCKILFMLWTVFCKKASCIPSKIIQREFQSNVRLCLVSNSNRFSFKESCQYRMASKGCVDEDKGRHDDTTHRISSVDSNSFAGSEIDLSSASAVDSSVGSSMLALCDFDCNILHKDMLDDKDKLADAASEVGIGYFVVPGSDLESSRAILGLSTDLNGVRLIGSAGVHPYNAANDILSEATLNELQGMVSSSNCYAVGECGLDYSNGFPDKDVQIPWFRSQVSMAVTHSRPLYLHSRAAEEDFMMVLEEFNFGINLKPIVPCCVHCFTGTTEELQRYVDCGFYIGLTGYIMTLDDQKLLQWLNMITLDKLVIETDAPYMGFKGCRSSELKEKKRTYPNVPVALVKILTRICAVSGWSTEEVTRRTTTNAIRGFLQMDM